MFSKVTIKSQLTGVVMELKQRINRVEIERSYKNITQTAKVVLPRYAQLVDPGEPFYKIRVGDAITIELGYDDTDYNTEFEGYITVVKPTVPMELQCEDEMWIQKQITVNKSWNSITMKELVTYLVPGTDVTLVPDVTFTPLRIDSVSVAKALEKLKDYGVVIYFRNKKLFVGFPYYDTNVKHVNYLLDSIATTTANAKAEGLEFRRAEDYKIKVRAISVLRDNKKLEVEVGDNDGELRTLHFSNITTEAELRAIAEQSIKRLKVDGLSGTFKSIGGYPYCDHGWVCSLFSNSYPERNGYYFIEKVKVDYNSNGYKRTVTPGRRAASL